MFNFFKKSVPTSINNFSSLIGEGVIAGEISAKGSIRVDGTCGTISGNGSKPVTVVVSKTGIVTGDITCDVAIIEGQVDGNVKAKQVCFHPTAKLSVGTSIIYDTLQVMPGAWIDGLILTKMKSESAFAFTVTAKIESFEGKDPIVTLESTIPEGPQNIILKEHQELPKQVIK